MLKNRLAFWSGVRAISPILVGVVPFAAISGIAAIEAGLSPGLAIAMSVWVYAGASQLAALQLIGAGGSLVVAALTAVVINLRFLVYSASLSWHLKEAPRGWKPGLAYILTDQAYAVAVTGFQGRPDLPRHWLYLGAALSFWVTWQVSALAGIYLGAQVPESWGLDFAIPLSFIALLVPNLSRRSHLAAALVAGVVVVVANGLPYNLGLITALLAGLSAGVLAGRVQEANPSAVEASGDEKPPASQA